MANLRTLNSRERKRILEQFEKQFGTETAFLKEYTFLLQQTKEKFYLANTEIFEREDFSALRVESVGLYLGQRMKNGEVRLSIEGSQLIGPKSSKGILEIDDAEFHEWIRGRELEKETEEKGFLIIKHSDDFVGSGKPVLDEKREVWTVHNYVPKTRYVRSEE